MSDLDFIEEIRIAQYWRKQLGEMEYVQRNPEDLRRWYEALELRGPEEIRSYLAERSGRHPSGAITGIVFKAPHPPREIIDIWLASHDKTRTMPYWVGALAFLVACLLVGPNVSGCQHLPNQNKFAVQPPAPQQIMTANPNGAPQVLSTVPGSFPLPANVASPVAGSQQRGSSSGQSGSQSPP